MLDKRRQKLWQRKSISYIKHTFLCWNYICSHLRLSNSFVWRLIIKKGKGDERERRKGLRSCGTRPHDHKSCLPHLKPLLHWYAYNYNLEFHYIILLCNSRFRHIFLCVQICPRYVCKLNAEILHIITHVKTVITQVNRQRIPSIIFGLLMICMYKNVYV